MGKETKQQRGRERPESRNERGECGTGPRSPQSPPWPLTGHHAWKFPPSSWFCLFCLGGYSRSVQAWNKGCLPQGVLRAHLLTPQKGLGLRTVAVAGPVQASPGVSTLAQPTCGPSWEADLSNSFWNYIYRVAWGCLFRAQVPATCSQRLEPCGVQQGVCILHKVLGNQV